MIKTETKERIILETIHTCYCDVIVEGEPCETITKTQCYNCKKHICNKHSTEEDHCGDYGNSFCPDCYKRYREYEDVIYPKYSALMEEEYKNIMSGGNRTVNNGENKI